MLLKVVTMIVILFWVILVGELWTTWISDLISATVMLL